MNINSKSMIPGASYASTIKVLAGLGYLEERVLKARGVIKIENDKEVNELEISILACYLPLNLSEVIKKKLKNYISNSPLFNDLIQMQIKDP